ncbi:hypothetical protein [Calothrix sp. 336/3]|uniref:hypothetical protein n=1 Tax=Calothrix sp. 336/3 TaxID=1337936 RepID=UPI000B160580|nr:hypothetical protein [Calothrix sp. 336/3]
MKTIKDRIFFLEDSSGKLLKLHKTILHQGKITIDNSQEQQQLILSGLVIRKG